LAGDVVGRCPAAGGGCGALWVGVQPGKFMTGVLIQQSTCCNGHIKTPTFPEIFIKHPWPR